MQQDDLSIQQFAQWHLQRRDASRASAFICVFGERDVCFALPVTDLRPADGWAQLWTHISAHFEGHMVAVSLEYVEADRASSTLVTVGRSGGSMIAMVQTWIDGLQGPVPARGSWETPDIIDLASDLTAMDLPALFEPTGAAPAAAAFDVDCAILYALHAANDPGQCLVPLTRTAAA